MCVVGCVCVRVCLYGRVRMFFFTFYTLLSFRIRTLWHVIFLLYIRCLSCRFDAFCVLHLYSPIISPWDMVCMCGFFLIRTQKMLIFFMRTLIRYEVDKKHIDYCTDEERTSTETQVKNNKTTAREEGQSCHWYGKWKKSVKRKKKTRLERMRWYGARSHKKCARKIQRNE